MIEYSLKLINFWRILSLRWLPQLLATTKKKIIFKDPCLKSDVVVTESHSHHTHEHGTWARSYHYIEGFQHEMFEIWQWRLQARCIQFMFPVLWAADVKDEDRELTFDIFFNFTHGIQLLQCIFFTTITKWQVLASTTGQITVRYYFAAPLEDLDFINTVQNIPNITQWITTKVH